MAMGASQLSIEALRESSVRKRDEARFPQRTARIADNVSHRPATELAAEGTVNERLSHRACTTCSHHYISVFLSDLCPDDTYTEVLVVRPEGFDRSGPGHFFDDLYDAVERDTGINLH
jgi:hypothetical protein